MIETAASTIPFLHPLPHAAIAQQRISGFANDARIISPLGFSRQHRATKKTVERLMPRAMRRDRRAACERVLNYLLHITDFGARVVQMPLAEIAKKIKMNVQRVCRVIRDLRRCGILKTVRRPHKIVNGKYLPTAAAVRRWGDDFIRLLGVDKLWRQWRQRRERQKVDEVNAAPETGMNVEAAKNIVGELGKKHARPLANAPPAARKMTRGDWAHLAAIRARFAKFDNNPAE